MLLRLLSSYPNFKAILTYKMKVCEKLKVSFQFFIVLFFEKWFYSQLRDYKFPKRFLRGEEKIQAKFKHIMEYSYYSYKQQYSHYS